MYRNGRQGVPVNDAEAVRWQRLSAAQGYVKAQISLGYMYANGRGVRKSMQRAYVWFSVAAAGQPGEDRDLAVSQYLRVSENFTFEQRSRAQALVATCFNSNFTDCGEPE